MAGVNRRRFLTGVGALIAAPAIVRASSLMPIFVMPAGGDFTTDNLLIHATERYVWGYYDPNAFFGTKHAFIRQFDRLGEQVFPTDAEARGWDMELYSELKGA